MVNNGRSNSYYKMIIEIQKVIKKKNIEIEYRKYLQNIIDQTNNILSIRNLELENNVKNLENQIYQRNWLYDLVYNKNEVLINDISIYKRKLDLLIQENNIYRELLKDQQFHQKQMINQHSIKVEKTKSKSNKKSITKSITKSISISKSKSITVTNIQKIINNTQQYNNHNNI